MKKLKITLIATLLLPILVNAQKGETLKGIYKDVTTAINSALLTRAGSIEVSGFANYNRFEYDLKPNGTVTQNAFQIEPMVSYFVVDNISVGLNITYIYQKTENDFSSDSEKLEQTYIGPIAKMYFGEKSLRPFIMADFLFLTAEAYSGKELDLGGGLFYQLSGNFGINLLAKYGIVWRDEDLIDSQNRIFIGIGVSGFIF